MLVLVEEDVVAPFPQRLVDVHPAAVLAVDGLGHERRVEPVHAGHPLDHVAEEHADVGHGQGVGEAQVDLVLAVGDLVVIVFGRDAHPLEQELDLLADLAVTAGEEVAALVEGRAWRSLGKMKNSSSGPTLNPSKPKSFSARDRARLRTPRESPA